jgi:hypothetical protein
MKSKRAHEGYLLVDNRCSGGGVLELPTLTCSHCSQIMAVNPLRTRERGYCRKCDHYICDNCNAQRVVSGGECTRVVDMAEKAQEAAFLEQQRNQHGLVSHNGILLTK